ncbi:MAG: GNAT family N-acetyltransferase [Elusimicrobiales bacterium]|nr:GNAT family N-acetyltransferase [Elusimicrobiales bacterium]
MVTLKKIDKDNYRECMRLSVAEDQSKFVAANARSLGKAYAFYETAHPFAVYADGAMVGFILYRDLPESGNYVIDQMMTDKRWQGKGYGRQAVLEVLKLMRERGLFHRACACCCINNEVALKFFRSRGFTRVVEEGDGEIVLGMDLH